MAEGVQDTVQRESTATDYWNTLNPAAIPYNNPGLQFSAATDSRGSLDFDSEDFQAYFNTADGATKKAMLEANNKEDALKVAQRRDIFNESQAAIEQDGMLTQLGMGLLPAIASPSSLLPMGLVFKGAQLARATSKIGQIAAFGGAGAGAGAVANIADEALFDIQGMPTNYLGAAAIGATFGGFLGGLSGLMVGPQKNITANALDPKNDSFTRDYQQDPMMIMELDESGVPKLQDIGQMPKSITDRIPIIGKALRSDVHTVYQSESTLLRGWMGRMSAATQSLKDAAGNVIPVLKTGVDVKREAKGVHNILTREVNDVYAEARTKGYTGDLETFNKDVWATYMEAMNRQRSEASAFANQKTAEFNTKDMTDGERNELFKKNREAMDEYYNTKEAEFKGDEVTIKAAESYKKYFNDMLKRSQTSGIKELQGLNVNRLYAPRTYNYKAIKDGTISQEIVYSEVKNGLANDVRNAGMSEKDLEIATKDIVNKLNESAFDLNNLTTSYMVKDLPFSTHLKSKKLHLNESFMPNVVKSNFEEVTGAYHYKMSGRQSVQYSFGTDNLDEIMKSVREEHLEKGIIANEIEIQAFERTVRDLMGDLRMNQLADTPSWSFTRNLTSFNSARLGGGFGGNQFIELASAVMLNGTKALFSGRMMKSLRNTKELLYKKGGKTDEFADYLIGSGYMEDALHTSRINRYADTESGFNSGVVENKLNWMNDKLMKYNGMRYFMGVMEDYTGGAIVSQLKQGNIQVERLARWGLTKAQGAALGKKLNKVTEGDGWDLSSLSSTERDSLQLAISRGIDEVVVQGDSIHLPAWMKSPGQFTKVLTQFMRFPLIAQESLLRRGMKEDQARMGGAVLGSISTYLGLKYLREQAAMSLGLVHQIDAKYDYENYSEEDWMRAIGESLNYTAPLGFMSSIYNYGAIATGNNELGREWQSKNGMASLLGPSGGLGEDLIQLMRSGVEGDFTDERSLQRWKSLVPFNNLPIINEGNKYLIEEFGGK